MRESSRSETATPRHPSLATRALEDLKYIRSTMERAGERAAHFTAIPGWGGVLMGTVASVAFRDELDRAFRRRRAAHGRALQTRPIRPAPRTLARFLRRRCRRRGRVL